MITMEGWLDRIVYQNETTRYTVARLKTGGQAAPVTVVGFMTDTAAGQAVKLHGDWTTHPRYGEQFAFEAAEITRPASVEGIRQYLQSGIVKGIGAATAKKIIAAFGADTLDVLDNTPHRLAEIDGIGPARADAIARQWQAHCLVSEIMTFLGNHGIRAAYGARIYATYGEQAMEVLRHAPYRIAEDIAGIGFYIADTIARRQGMAPDEPDRATACITHLLEHAASAGHTYVEADHLIHQMVSRYEMDGDTAESAIEDLAADGEIVVEAAGADFAGRAVFSRRLYRAEDGIAQRMAAMASIAAEAVTIPAEKLLAEIENRFLIRFSDVQRQAIDTVLSNRTVVITGGPGTGKTTLIKTIAAVFEWLGNRVCLAAPTGRAARRISEITTKPAHTIHKLLGYHFEDNTFSKSPDDPIDADVVIVDEASMIDTALMVHLIGAVRLNARLILVGDVFQLPPVGPGQVLSDIIDSETVPVCRLTTIFRQAGQSPIVVNAHKIRAGEMPELKPLAADFKTDSEFAFVEAATPEAISSAILTLCTETLPDRAGFDPLRDIQVVSPIHKGVAGTIDLNRKLQRALNRSSQQIAGLHHTFQAGDRVMHVKNNYAKEVFNGDIGIVTEIDAERQRLTADFYGRPVHYSPEDIDELSLGYAISVHKSQGSEYPVIIMPLTTKHYIMLQRNLLYTAVTRAQQLVILVGSEKALAVALKNDKPQQRQTKLAERLRGCCGERVYDHS
ncbi:MAG: SF1B family DNA helicase RecD2 [Thermodesulfobacteriota bacterium]